MKEEVKQVLKKGRAHDKEISTLIIKIKDRRIPKWPFWLEGVSNKAKLKDKNVVSH